jgi:hypothetical protein
LLSDITHELERLVQLFLTTRLLSELRSVALDHGLEMPDVTGERDASDAEGGLG